MKNKKQTTWKGQLPNPAGGNVTLTGSKNTVIGSTAGQTINIRAEPAYSVFNEESETWMRWDNQTEIMSINLRGRLFEIDPATIMNRHPMDVGAGTKDEAGDLAALRRKYEHVLATNPELKAIREEYDDLLEKYDILKAIEGDDNAKI